MYLTVTLAHVCQDIIYGDVCNSTVGNSKNLATTPVLFNRRMDKLYIAVKTNYGSVHNRSENTLDKVPRRLRFPLKGTG